MAILWCPRCQRRFFQQRGIRSLAEVSCAHCGLSLESAREALDGDYVPVLQALWSPIKSAEPKGAIGTSDPVAMALARQAKARGWTIVHSFGIEGDVQGMRIAVEYDPLEGRTYIDIDSLGRGVDRARLSELAETAGANVENIGSILRFVLQGTVDDAQVDRIIEAAAAACATGSPYRQ